jgi:membrane fusion protein
VLTIVPDGAPLVGRLLVPTSAIGFVDAGRPVHLRLAAFPYQRFGVHEAVVRDVGRSVLFAGDAYGPLRVTQPAYPATVALARQTLRADGDERPLQSGMLFDADVVLERRRVVEWLFEPLLGTWRRGA